MLLTSGRQGPAGDAQGQSGVFCVRGRAVVASLMGGSRCQHPFLLKDFLLDIRFLLESCFLVVLEL